MPVDMVAVEDRLTAAGSLFGLGPAPGWTGPAGDSSEQ